MTFARSPRGRVVLNVASAAIAVGIAVFAARHFAATGWPLARADGFLVAASGVLFLWTYAFKTFGWARLFAPADRPRPLALAAASGAASVSGAALPGRFDEVVRIAVVRRYAGTESGVATVCLSLFMLGLLDTIALSPLAWTATATSDVPIGVRAAMAVVATAGIGAAAVVLFLPRLASSARLVRFRITQWVSARWTAPRDAWKAALFILAAWVTRAVGLFLLLAALGVGISFPLAVAFLCAAAASGALPVAPAGAATQAGAGAAILIASGVATSQAIAFAVAAQALLILAGAAVVVFAAVWETGRRRLARAAA